MTTTATTPPVLTSEQRDLIERTLRRIDAQPELFDMAPWARETACGTVACFGGHLVWEYDGGIDLGSAIDERAYEILGLDDSGPSDALFYTSQWPAQFEYQYDAATSPAERAAALRARVYHWMETGE